MGFNAGPFFPDLLGAGGGGSNNLFSSTTTSVTFTSNGVTVMVVESPVVVCCNFAGNGFAGVRFLANCGFTILGERVGETAFFAAGAAFFATDFVTVFAEVALTAVFFETAAGAIFLAAGLVPLLEGAAFFTAATFFTAEEAAGLLFFVALLAGFADEFALTGAFFAVAIRTKSIAATMQIPNKLPRIATFS
jgi:hypothetical protein